MKVDVSRLRGPVVVLIAVAIALGCYGAVINAIFGRRDRWLLEHDQTMLSPTSIDVGARRILGILRERTAKPGEAGDRLGILVGASTLQHGIDPTVLGSELGGRFRWSNLLTTGHPYEFNLLVHLMYNQGLKPDVLVIVMGPTVMLPRANVQEERVWIDPRDVLRHIKSLRIGYATEDLVAITLIPWNLAFPYRGQVFTLVDRALFAAKLRILAAFGFGLEGLYGPDSNPWYETKAEILYPPATTDERKEGFLRGIENKGWFDADRYNLYRSNLAMLEELFRLAHAHGTRTFMVFVPESQPFRAKLPPDDDYHLTHTLKEALGPAAPIFLDFGSIAPDRDFHDPAHLNPNGLNRFTRALADSLKPYMKASESVQPIK